MITFGFSPCPNDTYIFYALVNGLLDTKGLSFDLTIDDVETLNQLAIARRLDVSKVSCHAYAYLRDDYHFLRAGGAFGRGCGPLIVAREVDVFTRMSMPATPKFTIAVPGRLTTALLLLRLYLAACPVKRDVTFVFMSFHKVMAAVKDGTVNAGLIIHESRFTYPDYGLVQVADLGEWWEKETGLPIPLGGIIAKKSLGNATIHGLEDLIRESFSFARSHTGEAMLYMKKYAQELSEAVILQHVALYVNDYSFDIGPEGEAALEELVGRVELLKGKGPW